MLPNIIRGVHEKLPMKCYGIKSPYLCLLYLDGAQLLESKSLQSNLLYCGFSNVEANEYYSWHSDAQRRLLVTIFLFYFISKRVSQYFLLVSKFLLET